MHQIIKNLLAILLISTVFSISTPIIAVGKIENVTHDEVRASINTTLEIAEKTLAALENGADKEAVLELLIDIKQMTKEIPATRRAAVLKGKAAKNDDLEAAKTPVAAGVEFYCELNKAFSGL